MLRRKARTEAAEDAQPDLFAEGCRVPAPPIGRVMLPADGLEAARKLGEGALIAMLRRSSPSLGVVFTKQSHDHVSAERHLALPGGRRHGDTDRAPEPTARNPGAGSQSCNLPALSRRSNIAIVECPSPSLIPFFVVFVPFLLVVQENDDHDDDR